MSKQNTTKFFGKTFAKYLGLPMAIVAALACGALAYGGLIAILGTGALATFIACTVAGITGFVYFSQEGTALQKKLRNVGDSLDNLSWQKIKTVVKNSINNINKKSIKQFFENNFWENLLPNFAGFPMAILAAIAASSLAFGAVAAVVGTGGVAGILAASVAGITGFCYFCQDGNSMRKKLKKWGKQLDGVSGNTLAKYKKSIISASVTAAVVTCSVLLVCFPPAGVATAVAAGLSFLGLATLSTPAIGVITAGVAWAACEVTKGLFGFAKNYFNKTNKPAAVVAESKQKVAANYSTSSIAKSLGAKPAVKPAKTKVALQTPSNKAASYKFFLGGSKSAASLSTIKPDFEFAPTLTSRTAACAA